MSVPTRRILDPIFGKPTLEAGGVGKAAWTTSLSVGTQRVAWAAKLDAGIQTSWNDYAKVIVPVNEVPFTDLKSVRLESYYTAVVGADMAVCVYMHDPNDFDQHIELSHTPLTNVGAGYRELNFPTDIPGSSWGWYGNVTDTPDTCPLDWDSASYTWAQFQADSVFSTWTIYRITFDYGYQTGSIVLDGGYLCQAQINGMRIPIKPGPDELLTRTGEVQDTPTPYTLLRRLKDLLTGIVLATGTNVVGWFKIKRVPVITPTTGTGTAIATLAPAAAFHLLGIRLHLGSALAAAETLTVTLDANAGAAYDVVLFTLDLGTPDIRDLVIPFGGEEDFFVSGDKIVIALSANTGSDTWGCETIHELV